MKYRRRLAIALLMGLAAIPALGYAGFQGLGSPPPPPQAQAIQQPGLEAAQQPQAAAVTEPALPVFYSVKVLCGVQGLPGPLEGRPPAEPPVKPGNYATSVNIHNYNWFPVQFWKWVALSLPPGHQEPGPVGPFVQESLGPFQALEVDCMDIVRLLPGITPPPFIKGFVELFTPAKLNVVAVYTAQACMDPPACVQLLFLEVDIERQDAIRIQDAPPAAALPLPTPLPRQAPIGPPVPTPLPRQAPIGPPVPAPTR